MWLEQPVIKQDLEDLIKEPINWSAFDGKTILITGATGLIGSALVNALVYYGMKSNDPPHIIAQVRSEEKALRMLGAQKKDYEGLEFLYADVTELTDVEGPVDYIIHSASPTASKTFVNNPVETISANILGTVNLLKLAISKKSSGFIYLSSMEVYGVHGKGERVTEEDVGVFDPVKPRSSYPLGKLASECMCSSYAAEYGVPAKIIRLAQTFGPGVPAEDTRVFAEIARGVMNGNDMVLRTTGESAHSYLYTMDAAAATLIVLLEGENGQAYTAANEETYCSIAEMAKKVYEKFGDGKCKVVFDIGDLDKLGYAPASCLDLDTSKIKALGFKARYNMLDMYRNMMEAF